MTFDIKTATAELCQAKARAEKAKEDRQILEKVLLSDEEYIAKLEEEKESSTIYEGLRKQMEEKSYEHMKEMKTENGTIYTDYGKITFKLEYSPIVKDEDQIISYLNEKGLQEFLKQGIRAKEFKLYALSQPGENEIPGVNIEEITKLTISTS